MTEEKIPQIVTAEVSRKKKKFSLVRVFLLFVIIFTGYFGLRYFEIKQAKKLTTKDALSKFDNAENDIFDLAEEYKNGAASQDPNSLSDIPLNEIQERGAEFVYKMLLKNQEQINQLKVQNQELRAEFTKYKSQEKLSKIIFAYVEFRQKIFNGITYEDALKNFEMLTISDQNLQEKVSRLKSSLKNFSDEKKLEKEFSGLIPEIIATKNNGVERSLFSKVRHNISKLVVIRRIDGKNPNDADGIVARTEKLLHEEKYQEAFDCLLVLDQNYHAILVNFLSELSSAADVKKIDSEILSYLKNLS